VLTARIDRLPEGPKRVLQTASVLGREFSVHLLEAVWDGGALAPQLQQLVRQEFLYERSEAEEPIYVFKHALTQDVAEATILPSRRRELNALAARALIGLYPDRLAELAPRLAHHYLQAEAWALACEHATHAAEAASAVWANREAVARYDQALAASDRGGLPVTSRLQLHAARGRAHGALGEFDGARSDFEAALALGQQAGDARACAELLGALGELWGGHQDYHRGLELTVMAVRAAESAADRHVLAEALIRTGLMRLNLGKMTDSQRDLERALAIFQELGDEHGGARSLDILAMTDGIVGRVARSTERGREASRRYERLGDRLAQSSMLASMGFWLGWLGRRQEAEPLMRQGLEIAIALGARGGEAYAHGCMAWIQEMYGDYGPALREGTMAIEIAQQIGHREWTANGLCTVGRITRIAGQAGRARVMHQEMLRITRELGSALWTPGALGELGADLIALGEADESERLLDAAIDEAGEATQFVVSPRLTQTDLLLGAGRFEPALEKAQRTCAAAPEYAVFGLLARAQQGQALLGLGRFDEGEPILRDVQARARAIGAAPALWQACLTLADHLSARGRAGEAASERAEALGTLQQAAAGLPDDLRHSFMDTPVMRRARLS
jgi:tetratricopeptide (TPR) repeat protein